jgi:hypothetical protein
MNLAEPGFFIIFAISYIIFVYQWWGSWNLTRIYQGGVLENNTE